MTDPRVAIPSDRRQWRPQGVRDGLRPERIANPIAEPLWSGTRVLVHYLEAERNDEWGVVEAFDEKGRDALEHAVRAFDQLRRSLHAVDAVLDGIVTVQAWQPGVDMDFDNREHVGERGDAAFVAFDLLLVDGEPLFDVPLVERKRLLDGLIEQSPLVRVSPWKMTPIAPYFRTWRRAGFRGIVIKAANSRYVPGVDSMEWTNTHKEPRF